MYKINVSVIFLLYRMMKMMGWKGGGLGADAQGIAEPIKPHLQMVMVYNFLRLYLLVLSE